MKNIMLILMIYIFLPCISPFSITARARSVSVLLLGNSITNRNNLSGILSDLSSKGYSDLDLTVAQVAPDGATFSSHLMNKELPALLNSRRWDFVVLQGGSDVVPGFSFNGRSRFTAPDRFLSEGKLLCAMAKSSGADVVIFQTLANSSSLRYARFANERLAESCDAALVPVGNIFYELGDGWRDKLLSDDGSHPTKLGTQLIAVILSKALFGPWTRALGSKSTGGFWDTSDSYAAVLEAAVNSSDSWKPSARDHLLKPIYASEPRLSNIRVAAGRLLSGCWRAKSSAFRLSFGSEICISPAAGHAVNVELTDYQTAGILVYRKRVEEDKSGTIKFNMLAAGVSYEISVMRDGARIKLLSSYRSNKDHKIFEERSYVIGGDSKYFAGLRKVYEELESAAEKMDLSAALLSHFEKLRYFVGGAEAFNKIRQGFPLSEWDEIMVAQFYANIGNYDRSLRLCRASVELYPDSVDAYTAYGDTLAAAGDTSAARLAFKRALQLNPGLDKDIDGSIIESIRKLSK